MKFDGLHVNLLENQEFHWESISQQDVKCELSLTKPQPLQHHSHSIDCDKCVLVKCRVSKETKQNIFARFLVCFQIQNYRAISCYKS